MGWRTAKQRGREGAAKQRGRERVAKNRVKKRCTATMGCTRVTGGHARRREDEPYVHALACCGVRVVLPAGDGEIPDLRKFSRRVKKKYI